jgi:hypothetical protein
MVLDVQMYIGCPCGCEGIKAGSAEEIQQITSLMEGVIEYAHFTSEERDYDRDKEECMEEIRSAFQAKRLTIRQHPRSVGTDSEP